MKTKKEISNHPIKSIRRAAGSGETKLLALSLPRSQKSERGEETNQNLKYMSNEKQTHGGLVYGQSVVTPQGAGKITHLCSDIRHRILATASASGDNLSIRILLEAGGHAWGIPAATAPAPAPKLGPAATATAKGGLK